MREHRVRSSATRRHQNADSHEPRARRRPSRSVRWRPSSWPLPVTGCGGSETAGHTITVTKTVVRHTKPSAAKAPDTRSSQRSAHAGSVPVDQMLGQMIVSPYAGSTLPPALLERVRAGEVGGVILFSENTAGGEASTRAQISELQAAASAGGKPPLLIMTDQEGGEVRRLTWAPPVLAAADMRSARGRGGRRRGNGKGPPSSRREPRPRAGLRRRPRRQLLPRHTRRSATNRSRSPNAPARSPAAWPPRASDTRSSISPASAERSGTRTTNP